MGEGGGVVGGLGPGDALDRALAEAGPVRRDSFFSSA